MRLACGKAVDRVGKVAPRRSRSLPFNRFKGRPQVFPIFSTPQPVFSTAAISNLSTFPQDLLLQLYILTNPYSLDGEFRGSNS